jgi:hypothetical protein
MSGGFCHIVLRLVETGYEPTVQRCTDEYLIESSPPGGQPIDKTDGTKPATSGCGTVGASQKAAQKVW